MKTSFEHKLAYHLDLLQLQFLFQNRHLRFSLLRCEEVKKPSPFNQDFRKLELFEQRATY